MSGSSARAELASAIRRRPRVTWWATLAIAAAFGLAAMLLATYGADEARDVREGDGAAFTLRVPPFTGAMTSLGRIGGDGGGVLIARGELASKADADMAHAVADTTPSGPSPWLAAFAIAALAAAAWSHVVRRSPRGRLVAVQLGSLALVVAACAIVKAAMLVTAISILATPVAVLAIVPVVALDRTVGIATGVLAAIAVALMAPFDAGAIAVLLVQAVIAGLVVVERPRRRARAIFVAGGAAVLAVAAAYPLAMFAITGHLPVHELASPARSAWLASIIGAAVAAPLAIALVPVYQAIVGDVTRRTLAKLGDLSHPLLKQLGEKAPGTWQHSLVVASLAETSANAIGADAQLARVGALFHDLGKSLAPKFFPENLAPGETPPEISSDEIFAHVTGGLATAAKHGLPDRVADFMHAHHAGTMLDELWDKCRAQGNPKGLTADDFRYPGPPPETRETAIVAICDAVELASRASKQPGIVDRVVDRIVASALRTHQLDALSTAELRAIAAALEAALSQTPKLEAAAPIATPPDPAVATTAPRSRAPRARAPSIRPEVPDAFAQTDASSIEKPGATPRATSDANVETSIETPRHRPMKVSKDGLPHVEHGSPSDGGAASEPAGAGAPVVAIDGEPDTGRHRVAKLAQGSAHEIAQFTADAKRALDDASRDIDLLPPSVPREDASAAVRRAITEAEPSEAVRRKESTDPPPPAARKRAATLPPIAGIARPTASLAPAARVRAPTVPPPAELRRPSSTSIPQVAPRSSIDTTAAGLSAPPVRSSGGKLPALIVERSGDSSPPPTTKPDDSAITQPRMQAALRPLRPLPGALGDDAAITEPSMPAAVSSDPAIALPPPPDPPTRQVVLPPPAPGSKPAIWSKGLAARVDAKLDGDFGSDTPVVAPSKAEIQALLDVPPDATRELSLEEAERLHREKQHELRRSDPAIDFTRRAPYPTAEVREEDIEAAIEIAPARRTGSIGIAKTKPKPPGES
ncbi:MAG TPA: HDIG domain-containing protein [Kofleriaceae bacterium]